MASIRNARLSLTRDASRKTVRAVVTCDVVFTPQDLCQMKVCPQTPYFKLRSELWGEDGTIFTGRDDHLYTYADIHYFPDTSPTATETRTFDVTVGTSLLNEDIGTDEIYGKLRLTNLYTRTEVAVKTNVISGNF
jgi:hypothetical protein